MWEGPAEMPAAEMRTEKRHRNLNKAGGQSSRPNNCRDLIAEHTGHPQKATAQNGLTRLRVTPEGEVPNQSGLALSK